PFNLLVKYQVIGCDKVFLIIGKNLKLSGFDTEQRSVAEKHESCFIIHIHADIVALVFPKQHIRRTVSPGVLIMYAAGSLRLSVISQVRQVQEEYGAGGILHSSF